MRIGNFFKGFGSQNQHFLPVFAQQATYLLHASSSLCEMTETMDHLKWKKLEKEIKACEVQGDALLTEFHEQLFEVIVRKIRRSDIQNIAMSIDEFLDNINDSAKSIPLYMPKRIDSQIADFAQYIHAESDAIKKIMLLFSDIKKNYTQIAIQCERITELEHAADETFAEYIGYIFTHESDPIELMKYKNIAETFEAATDAAKRVSDSIRKIIMRYAE
jgi:predicted phosphate transport protein (TIGR00153 family)